MASTTNRAIFQAIDGERKKPQRAYVPREVADSVLVRLREHGDGVQRVAKSVGLSIRETVDVLIERTEQERKAAYTRGLEAGRLMQIFPFKPAGDGAKKAA